MEILLFGITREIVGGRKLTVPAHEHLPTVGALKAWMVNRYPKLQHLTSLAVAVNSEYADDTFPLHTEYEIALLPPVSGG